MYCETFWSSCAQNPGNIWYPIYRKRGKETKPNGDVRAAEASRKSIGIVAYGSAAHMAWDLLRRQLTLAGDGWKIVNLWSAEMEGGKVIFGTAAILGNSWVSVQGDYTGFSTRTGNEKKLRNKVAVLNRVQSHCIHMHTRIISWLLIISETTGCFTVSGQSETPFFLDICRLILLFFKPLIKHSGGFDFWKENEIFSICWCSGPGLDKCSSWCQSWPSSLWVLKMLETRMSVCQNLNLNLNAPQILHRKLIFQTITRQSVEIPWITWTWRRPGWSRTLTWGNIFKKM